MRHPLQKLRVDEKGTVRFTENAIVQFLLDAGPFDMNALARMRWDDEDWIQFAQLTGYSIAGFEELYYVSDEAWDAADRARSALEIP